MGCQSSGEVLGGSPSSSPIQLRGGNNSVHLFSSSGTRETRYTQKDLPPAPLLVAPCSGPLSLSGFCQSLEPHPHSGPCLPPGGPSSCSSQESQMGWIASRREAGCVQAAIFPEPPFLVLETSSFLVYFCIPRYSINMTEQMPPL